LSLYSWIFGSKPEVTQVPLKEPATPQLGEIGATGTPIFSGFLYDQGEYNPDVTGLNAYRTYEKMRRSDAQVAATLMACKLPVRSAEWAVTIPDTATPIEKEAAEFVETCLFDDLDFDAVVSNALLMLDFGAAAHEDIYEIVGNRVRLKALAPRLPLTFYRWLCEPDTDNLVAIEQLGYRGGKWVKAEVPINKISLFTFQQEGANFYGRSLLRPMYQHWYIKSNLYKVDAMACERNGMGIPWARMGPNAKAEDRREAFTWLSALSAHEKSALLLPPEWEWGLKGVEGSVRDPKESIHHHNQAITMAGLAQFMTLGESKSGNRALGQTMSDFFYLGLQSTANQVARIISLTTAKRLVDFNFSGITQYPAVVPQQILSAKFETIVDALQKLASSNVVAPDDDLEAWVREKMGAPTVGTPRPLPRQNPIPPQQNNPAVTQSQEAALTASEDAASAPPQGGEPASGSPPVPGLLRTRREPRGAEKFLALAEIVGQLDRGRDEIAGALRRARSRVQAEIVNKLVNAPVRTMHRVSVAPDEKLIAEIEGILHGVYEFGVNQVSAERARQANGSAPSDASSIRGAEGRTKRDPLGVYADGVVSEFTNNLTQRATNVTLDMKRRPGDRTTGEIIRQVEFDLDEQSDKWIDGAASKGANEAFADGRADGYEEHKDEISEVYYSALLDLNTCEACAAADGTSGATPDDIADVPNPDCDGGDKCRCVHVYVFADEVRNK
jgi:phage gp29-like protein